MKDTIYYVIVFLSKLTNTGTREIFFIHMPVFFIIIFLLLILTHRWRLSRTDWLILRPTQDKSDFKFLKSFLLAIYDRI